MRFSPASNLPAHQAALGLLGIILLALGMRAAILILFPTIAHPDEVFQYLEQANRLLDGRGLVPWEYEHGARSWLLPGILAGAMRIGTLFLPPPQGSIGGVDVLLCLLGLAPVICGYQFGMRAAGLAGAITAGVVNAVWFENIYYSTHPLAESFASAALIGGLWLVYPSESDTSRNRLFVGAVLLGFSAALRLQMAPAVLVAMIGAGGIGRIAPYRIMVAGVVLPLVGIGVLDWLTLGWPFQSMVMNIYFNTVLGVAANFGVSSSWSYLGSILEVWGPMTPVITILALVGATRLRLVFVVAATIVLVHSAFGHKEDRFISPMLPLVMTLAAIGSVMLVNAIRSEWVRAVLRCGLPFGWAVISLLLAMLPANAYFWYAGRGPIRAERTINADPKACGVAIWPQTRWSATGGYALLRPGIPLYAGGAIAISPRAMAASTYFIAFDQSDLIPDSYHQVECWLDPRAHNPILQRICLWRRPGECSTTGEPLEATIDPDLAKILARTLVRAE